MILPPMVSVLWLYLKLTKSSTYYIKRLISGLTICKRRWLSHRRGLSSSQRDANRRRQRLHLRRLVLREDLVDADGEGSVRGTLRRLQKV